MVLQGLGPYSKAIKQVHDDLTKITKNINELCGIKESDTGLSLPSQWDLVADKQMLGEEQPLLVRAHASNCQPIRHDLVHHPAAIAQFARNV